jgi:hypothetical protein
MKIRRNIVLLVFFVMFSTTTSSTPLQNEAPVKQAVTDSLEAERKEYVQEVITPLRERKRNLPKQCSKISKL